MKSVIFGGLDGILTRYVRTRKRWFCPENKGYDSIVSYSLSLILSNTLSQKYITSDLLSFAIVAGAAGGSLSTETILILGFSNIFADALSMGVGEFLSSNAHNEWVLSERKREQWEMENYPEGEIREMIGKVLAQI